MANQGIIFNLVIILIKSKNQEALSFWQKHFVRHIVPLWYTLNHQRPFIYILRPIDLLFKLTGWFLLVTNR